MDSIVGHAAVAVTPSDTDNISPAGIACEYLYVGSSGNISLIPAGGTAAVAFANVPVGILPIRTLRVRSTGTTASNIVAVFK